MGRYKCAYNCDHSTDPDVKFFKFPLYNPRKLRKWLSNMKWKDWAPTRFSVLCINHFEEQYIDRAGKCVTLREDAVPTIFSPHDKPQKNKASDGPGRRKHRPLAAKTPEKEPTPSATSPPVPTNSSVKIKELNQREEQHTGDKDQKHVEKWRIIVDERLRKIDSFPHFFHGNYCVPQNILWAPDGDFSADCEHSDDVIEVKEPWQWLGLDIRGPLPQTMNGHRYILTLTDFYSRWVEAVPMKSCLPSDVAKNIADIIAHFGYPLRILSRLPHDIVHRINRDLKDHLKDIIALVVYHQQTGNVDLTTTQLIDRMVGDLTEEHSADWDLYLPAKVFSLCFKPHLATKERPFSLLCSKGLEPIQSPRGLDYVNSKIQDSAFVVRSKLVI
ncbi:uncharacterized protein LOC124865035 isoform X2 [Girardinichthys multiradiatus]|uniref:uncharacterized protein LOC124862750 isoform X2 n=1 Tax=Girardinichthys multiradiatus TaxID=208333 RepID=UPI001FABAC48|nr:uncharacterized protein LOC124862750 isoform X2 [Girardinichthys multiradiatus]XP_047215986.1 uncharacterized protein LOC124865035 isoform X2 [Girardinichthys multiradiatus]